MSTDWSEVRGTIELVKETVSCFDVAEMLGVEPNSSGKIPSPWNPDERTPSCHLWEDHFFCFSTGKGGDVIDLAQALVPDLSLSDAVDQLWLRALRAGLEPGEVERKQPRELPDFFEDLDQYPGADILGYPTSRYGVRVDHDGNFLVPHRDQDRWYGVKVRFDTGGKGSWAGSVFTHKLYDPMGWTIAGYLPTVVLAEGESDSWALSSVLDGKAEVLALPSGAGAWKDHWLEDLKRWSDVRVCMDNDQAGQRARDKLVSKIGADRALPLRVPPLYNDAREAVAAGWSPDL